MRTKKSKKSISGCAIEMRDHNLTATQIHELTKLSLPLNVDREFTLVEFETLKEDFDDVEYQKECLEEEIEDVKNNLDGIEETLEEIKTRLKNFILQHENDLNQDQLFQLKSIKSII